MRSMDGFCRLAFVGPLGVRVPGRGRAEVMDWRDRAVKG